MPLAVVWSLFKLHWSQIEQNLIWNHLGLRDRMKHLSFNLNMEKLIYTNDYFKTRTVYVKKLLLPSNNTKNCEIAFFSCQEQPFKWLNNAITQPLDWHPTVPILNVWQMDDKQQATGRQNSGPITQGK